ncbi:MAG: hypothetical protein ACKO0Z_12440 [Betaproteobacteria bacterium]
MGFDPVHNVLVATHGAQVARSANAIKIESH